MIRKDRGARSSCVIRKDSGARSSCVIRKDGGARTSCVIRKDEGARSSLPGTRLGEQPKDDVDKVSAPCWSNQGVKEEERSSCAVGMSRASNHIDERNLNAHQ